MKKNAEIREYTRSFYQGNRLNFALALILIVLNTGGMLFFSWVLGEVTNIMAAGDLDRLWQTLGITVVALVLILTVELLMYYFKTKFVHKALRQYKDLVFSRLSEKSISAFSRENTSRYLSVLTNDANSIEENYLNRSILLIFQGAMFLGGAQLAADPDHHHTQPDPPDLLSGHGKRAGPAGRGHERPEREFCGPGEGLSLRLLCD